MRAGGSGAVVCVWVESAVLSATVALRYPHCHRESIWLVVGQEKKKKT